MCPWIEALATEFESSATVGKLNVEENSTLAERFAIHSIPSLLNLRIVPLKTLADGVIPRLKEVHGR